MEELEKLLRRINRAKEADAGRGIAPVTVPLVIEWINYQIGLSK